MAATNLTPEQIRVWRQRAWATRRGAPLEYAAIVQAWREGTGLDAIVQQALN